MMSYDAVTILRFEPDCDGGEFDEAHEVGEQLVVSDCHAPELLKKRSMMLRSL